MPPSDVQELAKQRSNQLSQFDRFKQWWGTPTQIDIPPVGEWNLADFVPGGGIKRVGNKGLSNLLDSLLSKKAIAERWSRIPHSFDNIKLKILGNTKQNFRYIPKNGFFEKKNINTGRWQRVSHGVEKQLLEKEWIFDQITRPE